MQVTDFSFAWEGARGPSPTWEQLRVVRFTAHEHISRPYLYDIHIAAGTPGDEVDPCDLVGKRATLRIHTLSNPERKVVHGIVVEASDVAPLPEGQLYRIVLMPPLVRLSHRRRCRIFLEKTTRHIIDAVLQGEPLLHAAPGATVEEDMGAPDYHPPKEEFTWRVRDASRIDDVRVRPYVVQYNESDLAFVSRLLEAEGLSYHFENGEGACLLVITDHDGGRPRVSPESIAVPRPPIRTVHLGARLRSSRVVFDDYNWHKPKLSMEAKAEDEGPAELSEYHYPGGYPDAPRQGEPLAKALVDRYAVEAKYAVMEGASRVLSAGTVFELQHEDQVHDGEYLVTSLEIHGEQGGAITQASVGKTEPFRVVFECALRGKGKQVAESRFRPAMLTPKPRIGGSQTALVTAEPSTLGTEVHVGGPDGLSVGCVRLQFHWDKDTARHAKEATSCWVRVNQPFAGVGEGGVWHPRVGVEAIVDFENGDPDRPIIIGRLYNGAHLPPRTRGEHSTMKSFSTPGGAVYNELTFEDQAGGELLHLNAGKNHNIDVGNCRLETVASNAVMKVGSNNAETIGADCTVHVGANHTLTVGANQSITVAANSTTTVGGNSTHTTGANKSQTIGAAEAITIGATLAETVAAAVTEVYGATKTTSIAASITEAFSATKSLTVGANATTTCGGAHTLTVNGARFLMVGSELTNEVAGAVVNNINGLSLNLFGGEQSTHAPSITKNCPIHFVLTPFDAESSATKAEAKALHLSMTGINVAAKGAVAHAYGASSAICGVVSGAHSVHGKISGPSTEATGMKVTIYPIAIYTVGVVIEA